MKRKQQRVSADDMATVMGNINEQFLTTMAECEEKRMKLEAELEEKRMKHEVELEEKRRKHESELEEKRRDDERRYEERMNRMMFSMVQQAMGFHSAHPNTSPQASATAALPNRYYHAFSQPFPNPSSPFPNPSSSYSNHYSFDDIEDDYAQ